MKKIIIVLTWLLIIGCAGIIKLNGQSIAAETALNKADNTFFIENKGQWPEEVLFLTRIGGLDAWITKEGVVYDFYKMKEVEEEEQLNIPLLEEADPGMEKEKEMQRYGQVVKLQLQKSKTPALKPAQKQEGYYNYFLGNDNSKWASNVSLYKEIRLENVYDDIDVKYYFDKENLRYDYIVKPGGDPTEIQFVLEGANDQYINSTGELVFDIRFGVVEQKELMLYQLVDGTRMEVEGKFRMDHDGKSIGFEIAAFDQSKELIIDPLVYSTFLGGGGLYGQEIAVESDHAYITGLIIWEGTIFPTTVGAYDESYNGANDVFVTKLTTDGSDLVYSTFLGGSHHDHVHGIAVESGQVYITGSTLSSDFPTTKKAYDQSFNYDGTVFEDVFVTKLNSDGNGLVYSTYLGGSNGEVGKGIAVESGNAYITGWTISEDFPTTEGAYDQSFNQGGAFVTKLDSEGEGLVYSTFLGGSNGETGMDIAVESGNAYITGHTQSPDFPTTEGAYDQSYNSWANGWHDGFVTKLTTDGDGLVYSTYLGGSYEDSPESIAIESGHAYVTGWTMSLDFPTTDGAYDESFDGYRNIFVTKFTSDGGALVYSTFLGGGTLEESYDIAVESGNAYITGQTPSSDFPTTEGAYDQSFNGYTDIFVTKFTSDGGALAYSTYLGGWDGDWAVAIAVVSGQVYITGGTSSSDFPTTEGAYCESYLYGEVAFVTKMGTDATTNSEPIALCQDITIVEGCEGSWSINDGSYDPDGDPITITIDPTGPYPLGDTEVTMTVSDGELEAQCIATITVTETDDEAPVITTVPVEMEFVIWPPNHTYETYTLEDFIVSIEDNCTGSVPIDDVNIIKATSDEPDNLEGDGDGNTINDIVISEDCKSIQLRKERQGTGNGRVYTIYFEVDDGNGNLGSATCQIQVPHDNNGTAIDDGDSYEITGNCDNKSSFIAFTDDNTQLTNYPNPFNGSTTITFTLEETANTTLKVYDSFGREVATLFDGVAVSGQYYSFDFNGQNLTKGIYLFHLQSGNKVSIVKKMILMK